MSFHYISPHTTQTPHTTIAAATISKKISREQFDVHLHTSSHGVSAKQNERMNERECGKITCQGETEKEKKTTE